MKVLVIPIKPILCNFIWLYDWGLLWAFTGQSIFSGEAWPAAAYSPSLGPCLGRVKDNNILLQKTRPPHSLSLVPPSIHPNTQQNLIFLHL